jgi:hypothetical protein
MAAEVDMCRLEGRQDYRIPMDCISIICLSWPEPRFLPVLGKAVSSVAIVSSGIGLCAAIFFLVGARPNFEMVLMPARSTSAGDKRR